MAGRKPLAGDLEPIESADPDQLQALQLGRLQGSPPQAYAHLAT